MAATANVHTNSPNDIAQGYLSTNDNIVTIEVGLQKKPYCLLKDELCSISPYFQSALNGSMRESTEQLISLQHVDTVIFNAFLYWLHYGKIGPFDQYTAWSFLVELYIFADSHELYGLMNATSDAMITTISAVKPKPKEFDYSVLHSVYNYSTPRSKLRKLFVDMTIYKSEMIQLRHDLSQHYPDEYLADLCQDQYMYCRIPLQLPNDNPTNLELAIAQRAFIDPRVLSEDLVNFKDDYHVPTTSSSHPRVE